LQETDGRGAVILAFCLGVLQIVSSLSFIALLLTNLAKRAGR
jgi:hypothetical protein